MAKRTRYSEYKDRYANYPFELDEDGVLFMQCHTNGDSLVWSWDAHDGLSDAFADIAGDREIKVLIHTGTGENYNANWGAAPGGSTTKPIYLAMEGQEGLMELDEKAWYGRMLVENVLAVEVPMISAVNGPCSIHSEVPLLSDIVLASDDRLLPGPCALSRGVWCRVTVPMCSGRCSSDPTGRATCCSWARSSSAQEALEWGVVAEVLPQDELVDRAWEVARELVQRPPLVLRYTRSSSPRTSSARSSTSWATAWPARPTPSDSSSPQGGGMRGLDRAWDQEPWSD